MELKGCTCWQHTGSWEFQSHLYGIESGKAWHQVRAPGCFNRTFMELKAENAAHANSAAEFQSHLYGIEREVCREYRRAQQVSIAPLWNWKVVVGYLLSGLRGFNRTFMELKASILLVLSWIPRFQSHLYGIESIQVLIASAVVIIVSIAPLWNWKDYKYRVGTFAASFNRTFMELKGKKSLDLTSA